MIKARGFTAGCPEGARGLAVNYIEVVAESSGGILCRISARILCLRL